MNRDTPNDRTFSGTHASARLTRLVIAGAVLGLTLEVTGGRLAAIGLLGLLFVIAEASIVALSEPHGRDTVAWRLLAAILAVQTIGIAVDPVLQPMSPVFRMTVAMLAVIGSAILALLCVASARHLFALFAVACVVAAMIGLCVLRELPKPGIDVVLFQQESARALLQGLDPYAMRFSDPYPPKASAIFYGPGVSVGGVLQFGFPYMPISLLLAIPAFLAGDIRYTSLAAMLVSAWLIARAQPSRGAYLGGTLLALSAAMPQMLYQGWIESTVVLCVAVVWFCQCRMPKLVPYATGLLFVSKQYMIIAAPVVLLLARNPRDLATLSGFGIRAGLAGAAITLPFVLRDPSAFMASAVWLQFRQPVRADALSFLVWAAPDHPLGWLWLAFVAPMIAWGVILLRNHRRPVSFPLALALTMLLFFSLNKQAFLNYYYLVLGCLCCAIAAESKKEWI